jgi:hypothetical protein
VHLRNTLCYIINLLCLYTVPVYFQFYHLASVRIQELCLHLNVRDMELKRKIWTCFEHSIIHHTDLMQDRHLDQILMCSVYVMCKVCASSYDINDDASINLNVACIWDLPN